MRIAVVREVSPQLAACELSFLPRTAIDAAKAQRQHGAYVELLRRLGCRIVALPAEPALPDSVFVEDAAVVLPGLAVITRPGAPSRRPETKSVAAALAPHRPLAAILPPGTLDGGDVLFADGTLFVGLSRRSSEDGIAQLRALAAGCGIDVRAVPIEACLHLKSAVTAIGRGTLLINPSWVDVRAFPGFAVVAVDPDEPHAANALDIGGVLVCPASFPRTCARLREKGFTVETVDVSELQKAEGAVTCCSLVFETPVRP